MRANPILYYARKFEKYRDKKKKGKLHTLGQIDLYVDQWYHEKRITKKIKTSYRDNPTHPFPRHFVRLKKDEATNSYGDYSITLLIDSNAWSNFDNDIRYPFEKSQTRWRKKTSEKVV